MTYNEFVCIMEKHIHESEKKSLLEKIAKTPDRFVGLYRATTPIAKISQFLSQSREIRFGDGLEEVIGKLLEDMGYINLPKNIKGLDGSELNIDQYFKDNEEKYYFVEQKVRDDHDSTKKRGQIENFKKKYDALLNLHGEVIGLMYFIDPGLTKNKNYYKSELSLFSSLKDTNANVLYGQEFFQFFNRNDIFETLECWLKQWRNSLPTVLNLNFDEDVEDTYNEIKHMEKKYWKKIINNKSLWEEKIIQTLFPTGDVLKKIVLFFDNSGWTSERNLLNEMILKYY